tara:strand:+ start:1386 stop:1649 length:264 start_codon:yes stop_codon:yes gene_type:complete
MTDKFKTAFNRQCDNMSFVLNRLDLYHWSERFAKELEEDRQALKDFVAEYERMKKGLEAIREMYSDYELCARYKIADEALKGQDDEK